MAPLTRLACLLGPLGALAVDGVSMLQAGVSATSQGALATSDTGPVSSFVPNQQQDFCMEGPSRALEAALATWKAGPAGILVNDTWAKPNETCLDRGYTQAKEETCFVGLQAYSRTGQSEDDVFMEGLMQYSSDWNLSLAEVQKAMSCSCHPESKAKAAVAKGACESITFAGSWVHRNPLNGKRLMCNHGPYLVSLGALAVLKTSMQLPMHLHDQVAPVTCDKQGFPVETPKECHCFPPMKMNTLVDPRIDEGIKESGDVEAVLMKGAFEGFRKENNLDPLLTNLPFCNCLEQSEVGMQYLAPCREKGLAHSPVRDWWRR